MNKHERKQGRSSFVASQETFEIIFQNSSIGIALIGRDGKYLKVNAKFCNMLGYSEEELLKAGYKDLTYDEDAAAADGVLADAFSGKAQGGVVRKRYVRKDGAIVWVEFSFSLAKNSRREPEYLIANFNDITDWKRAEEKQETERNLLRTVIDNLPSAVFVKDKEYRKTVVNSQHVQAVAAHLGRPGLDPGTELLGKTDFDVYPRGMAEAFYQEDQKVIREGKPVRDKEEMHIKADSHKKWMLVSKIPLRDRNGEITGMVGITTDITAQKEAEEAAQRDRILLRTIIDNIPHSVYVKDVNYRKIIANQENLRHTGLRSEAEVWGKTDFDVLPRDLAEKFHVDDQAVIMEGKSVINREENLTDASGTLRWLLTTKVPLRNERGDITGLVGIGIDITERKRIEERLRESEERLRTIFENVSIGIYQTTPDGKVLLANPAMINLLGFDNFEVLSKYNVEEEGHYLAEYPRERFRNLIEKKGHISGLETKRTRKDGSVFWVRENARVVYDENHNAAYYEGTLEDISETKKAQEELESERTLLRTLIEHLPSSVFIKDKSYRKLLCNKAHVLGISEYLNRPGLTSQTQILGKTDFEVYPKDLAEEYFADDQQVIRDGLTILDREEVRNMPDGTKRWSTISKIPILDNSDQVVGMVGIVNDITKIKEAEEAQRQERILLRTIIDHLPASIWAKDRNYRRSVVNKGHVQRLSLFSERKIVSENDVLGKTDLDLYSGKQAEEYHLEDLAVMEQGRSVINREEVVTDLNGETHWQITSKVPLQNDLGETTGLVGIVTDITPQKETTEALRVSEMEMRALFSSMHDIVLVLDVAGKYLKVAPTAPDLLYRPAEELIGRTLHEVLPSEKADLFIENIDRALQTRELQNFQYSLTRAGSEVWFDANMTPMTEDSVLLVARDVTKHKLAEDALRQSEGTLRMIASTIPDAIYSIDGKTGEFDYLSPAFEKLLGYTFSDIAEMGGRWHFLQTVIRDAEVPALDPVMHEMQDHRVNNTPVWDRWWQSKDGRLLYIEDISVSTYDGDQLVQIYGVLRDITQRKLAEDAVQRERILLRTIIDNLPYSIYVKDKEGRKIAANPTDVEFSAVASEAELIGKTDFDLYPRELAEKFFADDMQVIREGKPIFNREEPIFDRHGNKHWFLTTKVPVHDPGGAINGLAGVGVDITERKAVDEALRQSEAELRALFESMEDVVIAVDSEGKFLKVAPTDPNLLYKPAEDIVGKSMRDVFPEDQAGLFMSVIRNTLETKKTQTVDYELNIGGVQKWRSATVSSLSEDSVIWVARDMTERKAMEKELVESEKKYRELVESALVGVYKINLSGTIVYVNKAMADMLEYDSPQEMMAVRGSALYRSLGEMNDFVKDLQQYGRTGESKELELVTKNGKVKNVLLSASLEKDVISGMAKDMTDIRALERRIIQSQKLEGLGNIAAGIAHDFNNLLGVILGYAELLGQPLSDQKKTQRGLQAIQKSAERGKSLVKQLLTFARKTEITFAPLRVNEIILEVEKLMLETFPRTIEIKLKLEQDQPLISADSTQVQQVFLNLCLNARDAMPRGGTLSIVSGVVPGETLRHRYTEAVAKRYVEIRISDNGIGMDEETTQHIFEPFFTTKDIGKGTGLGLSVVYGILESHKGFVEVTSNPGTGTSFNVYFPEAQDLRTVAGPGEESDLDVAGGNDTILAVEDEAMLRDLVRMILGSKGYNVLTANDGEQAIGIFHDNKEKIALVICDLGLPKLGGEGVATRIKEMDPAAKIVIASGYIDFEVRTNLEKLGISKFVQKPYRSNEVLKAVRDELDLKR